MAIHNLDNGAVTLTVAAVTTTVSPNFNQKQYRISDTNGDVLFVGKVAADKQFDRLKLTADTLVGETFRVERVEKDGTKYTNFYRATAGAVTAPAASAPARAAAAAPMDLSAIASLYAQCVDKAIATLGVQCEAAGIAFDASAIQAAAATMFIRATK